VRRKLYRFRSISVLDVEGKSDRMYSTWKLGARPRKAPPAPQLQFSSSDLPASTLHTELSEVIDILELSQVRSVTMQCSISELWSALHTIPGPLPVRDLPR
jgi:hypothetical protein